MDKNRKNWAIISIIFGVILSHCSAQGNLHFTESSGLINSAEVVTGRSISSGTFTQTNFVQGDDRVKPIFRSSAFVFNSKSNSNTQGHFETPKPLPFVIPSYASGILGKTPTAIASNVSSPSEFLLPPIYANANDATTLNSIDAETTTLLPITQDFNLDAVTQRSSFNNGQFGITTIQSKSNIFTGKQSTPISSISKSSYQFGTKPITRTTTTTTTTISPTVTTTTARSTSPFTTKSADAFGKSTFAPAFGLGFYKSRRDEILGNQQPGYAIRPDGSIDSEALPPQYFQTKLTTTKPFITQNNFETTTTTTTVQPPKIATTATKFITTQKLSTNFKYNPWLQQATSLQKTTSFGKQNSKPFVPSFMNPFLMHTTSHQPSTTTSFPKIETSTKPFYKGFSQFSNGTSSKSGLQMISNEQNNILLGNGIRDRDFPLTTIVDGRGQFFSGSSSPKPFNTIKTTVTPNTVVTKLQTNFSNFDQRNLVTQKATFNGFNNNKNTYTNTNINHVATQSPKKPQNNSLQNEPSGFVIQVPDTNLLPPPLQGNTQPALQTTRIPIALQPTKIQTFQLFSTTMPTTKLSSKLPPTTRVPLVPTTTMTTTMTTTTSTLAPTTTSTLSPTTASTTIIVHKSSSISLPSNDLLPPRIDSIKSNESANNEPIPNDFFPQLDLNPFLPPFLESIVSDKSTSQTEEIITTTASTTTIKSLQFPQLEDSPFDYRKPAVPFVIQANVPSSSSSGRQRQQQEIQQSNTKYTGSFGGPPGVLKPFDNLG